MLGAVKSGIEHRPGVQGSISSDTRLGGGLNGLEMFRMLRCSSSAACLRKISGPLFLHTGSVELHRKRDIFVSLFLLLGI